MISATFVITVALTVQHPPASPEAAQPVWPDDHPITQIGPNLRRDLRKLPRLATYEIVGAGVLASALASSADDAIAGWVHERGRSLSYTPIGNLIGNEWLQGGASIATYAIGVVQKSPEVAHIGSDLIRAQMLNGVLTVGMKLAASRTRPDGGSWSFPSGHSSATFASATVLADHYGWKVGLPAYAVAGFIGWTRIRDHQHWLSDVIAGSAIGLAAGKTVTLGHRAPRWLIVPVAVPGGGGILITRRPAIQNSEFRIQNSGR